MKKVIKIILIVIIMIITMQLMNNEVKAVEETEEKESDVVVRLECNDKIEAGKTVTVSIKLTEVKKNVDTFIGTIEYDKNIFEEITEDDMEPVNKWSYPVYNEKVGIFMIEKTKGTEEDEEIMKITLRVKDNVTETKSIVKLTDLELAGLGIDLVSEKETVMTVGEEKEPEKDPEQDVPPEEKDKLYLSTEVYKIGNNDIKNYEEGDKYISRVMKQTTKETYISNLKTNGKIRIIKTDGTELGDNELVGTGMTLEVTKGEEKIELQIAVMGDVSGDGKVTATDLSTLNQTILKVVTLENEYKIAGDLDENDNITPTDLSTLNKMLLKIL